MKNLKSLKKLVVFLVVSFIFLFPIKANARVSDVSITSVTIAEKVGSATTTAKPSFSGMNINFNIKFFAVNDAIKYKVSLVNDGFDDVTIKDPGAAITSDSSGVKYEFTWNGDNVIKANSSQYFFVTVTYAKTAQAKAFLDNEYYSDQNLMQIELADKDGTTTDEPTDNFDFISSNPQTNFNIHFLILFFTFIILALIIVTIYLRNEKKIPIKIFYMLGNNNFVIFMLIILLLVISIVGYSFSLNSVNIEFTSKIEISGSRLARSCLSESYADNSTNFCLNWNGYLNPNTTIVEKAVILTQSTKVMANVITYDSKEYSLQNIYDVSETQNNGVNLGVYSSDNNYLLIIGQNGGVAAPSDLSYLFGSNAEIAYREANTFTLLNTINTSSLNVMAEVSSIDLNNFTTYGTTNMNDMFFNNGINTSNDYSIIGLKNLYTTDVTTMSGMFRNVGGASPNLTLNDLNYFDTSNVVDMGMMFEGTGSDSTNFKLDLTGWNTSKVTNMNYMFSGAGQNSHIFSITSLDNFNTSSVSNMEFIFSGAAMSATNIDLNLSSWDVSNVEVVGSAFSYFGSSAQEVDLSLAGWNLKKVESMNSFFKDLGFYSSKVVLNITGLNTSNVKVMDSMFEAFGYNNVQIIGLDKINLSGVESASRMFCEANIPINYLSNMIKGWNLSKAVNLTSMFRNIDPASTNFTLDLSEWDVSNVQHMEYMFSEAGVNATSFNLNLTGWNTAKVKSFSNMFSRVGVKSTSLQILGLKGFDTSTCQTFASMFAYFGNSVSNLNLDLSTWNTANVATVDSMFINVGASATTFNVNLSGWTLPNVLNVSSMFNGAARSATTATIRLDAADFSDVASSYMVFARMPDVTKVYVKDADVQTWVYDKESLNANGVSYVPTTWTKENNILIAS